MGDGTEDPVVPLPASAVGLASLPPHRSEPASAIRHAANIHLILDNYTASTIGHFGVAEWTPEAVSSYPYGKVSKQNTKAAVRGAMIVAGCMGLALAWACSSNSGQPGVLGSTTGEDSGTVTGGDATTRDGGPDSSAGVVCKPVDGGCASIANCSKQIDIIQVAQNAPAQTGGVVTQGTYYLVDYTLFTGPGGVTGNAGWYTETQQIGMASTEGDAGEGGTLLDASDASEAGQDGSSTAPDAGSADADEDATQGEAGEVEAGTSPDAGADSGANMQVFPWLDVSESNLSSLSTFAGMITFEPPNSVFYSYACPSGNADFAATYTATATQLQIFYPGPNGAGTVRVTYDRL